MEQEQTIAQTQSTEAAGSTVAAADDAAHITDELLVEEISIDGMCGVY